RQDPPGGTARFGGGRAAVLAARHHGILGGRLHLVRRAGLAGWVVARACYHSRRHCSREPGWCGCAVRGWREGRAQAGVVVISSRTGGLPASAPRLTQAPRITW